MVLMVVVTPSFPLIGGVGGIGGGEPDGGGNVPAASGESHAAHSLQFQYSTDFRS
jgi:hypothetical protein